MLNNETINSSNINYTSISITGGEEQSTSFSSIISGKYAFLSNLGYIFNFNTFLCGKKTYGNFLKNQNLDDMAFFDIIKYNNSLSDGGVLQKRNFTETIINLKLVIVSSNIESLENEIKKIKSIFNLGGKIYKKEYNRELLLDVFLAESITVGEKKISGTEINITFSSLNPFWYDKNAVCLNYEGLTTDLNSTLNINNSDIETSLKTIIQIKTISGNVNKLFLNLNGYILEVNSIINNNDIIIIDGQKNIVTINNIPVLFKGTFQKFPINKPSVVLFYWSGGGNITNYNLYILYNIIAL